METLQQHNPGMFNPSWKTEYLKDLYFQPKEHLLVLDFHPQCNRHRFWEGTQVTDGDSQMKYHIQQKHREDRKGRQCYTFQWQPYTYQRFSSVHSCNILLLSEYLPSGWPCLRGPHHRGQRIKWNTTMRTQLGKSGMWGVLKDKWSGSFYQKTQGKKKKRTENPSKTNKNHFEQWTNGQMNQ